MNYNHIAKEVVGEMLDIPPAGKRVDKVRLGLEIIRKAEEEGFIWNTDFQEIKQSFRRAIEDEAESISRPFNERVRQQGYGQDETWQKVMAVSDLRDAVVSPPLSKFDRAIRKLQKSQDDPILEECRLALLNLAKAWEPWAARLSALTIKKGRKPNPNAKPAYMPPPGSMKDLAMVQELVVEVTQELHDSLIKDQVAAHQRYVQMYLDNRTDSKESPYQTYRDNRNLSWLPSVLVRLVENDAREWNVVADVEQRIAAMADEIAQDVQTKFSAKMLNKLTSIIGQKGSLKSAEKLYMQVNAGTYTGRMKFAFEDGSSFMVQNSVVVSHSPKGNLFYRFPTTFHDVVVPGQKIPRQVSEEWMNEVFSVQNPSRT